MPTSRHGQKCGKSDVAITGDTKAQLAVPESLPTALISAPRHDDKVSIQLKLCLDLAIAVMYSGILYPSLLHFHPTRVAHNLLTYRYHTLDGGANIPLRV